MSTGCCRPPRSRTRYTSHHLLLGPTPLQRVETVSKQSGRDVVESSDPPLLRVSRQGFISVLCLPRTSCSPRQNPCDTPRLCTGLVSVLLAQRSSVHALRHWLLSIVQTLHRYQHGCPTLKDIRVDLAAHHLRPNVPPLVSHRAFEVSWFSRMKFPAVLRSTTSQGR
jgi:hypothetical protein